MSSKQALFRYGLIGAVLCCIAALATFQGESLAQGGRSDRVTIYAPFWQIGGGYNSSLVINNSRPHKIEVETVVYDSFGRRIPSDPITLDSLASVDLNLRDLIKGRGGYGNIALSFSGKPLDLAAQMLITNREQGTTFNGGFTLKAASRSSRLVGVSYLGRSSRARLALSNISDRAKTVQIGQRVGGKDEVKTLTLGAHQTVLMDLRAAKGDQAIGLVIDYDGAPGDVMAHGLVIGGSGLGTNMQIIDPAKLKSNHLLSPAARVLAGQRSLLGLNNLGKVGLEVVPRVRFRVGRELLEQTLAPIKVGPNAASGVDLTDQLAALPPGSHDLSLALDYEGQPGSLVAELLLVDEKSRSAVQATPKDRDGEGAVALSFPFRLDGGSRTIIAVANPSMTDEAKYFVVLFYEGNTYTYDGGRFLQPGEAKHIDIRRLRDEQIPGEMGVLIPKDVVSGQVKTRIHSYAEDAPAKLFGQAIQVDSSGRTTGFLSCPVCPPDPDYVTLSPLSFTGNVGTSKQITPRFYFTDGSNFINNNPNAIDWYPGSSSVATVSEAWNNFQVQYEGAGSTTIDATMPNECYYEYDEGLPGCVRVGSLAMQTATPAQVQSKVRATIHIVPSSASLTIDRTGGSQSFIVKVSLEGGSFPVQSVNITVGVPNNPGNVLIGGTPTPKSMIKNIGPGQLLEAITFQLTTSGTNTNSGTLTFPVTVSGTNITPSNSPKNVTVQTVP